MNKFNPSKFLNGEINIDNCNHEVVFKSSNDEGRTGFYFYYCPICSSNIIQSISSGFENNRCVYLTDVTRTKDIHYIKGFITSLAYCNKDKEYFNLNRYFIKHKEEIKNESVEYLAKGFENLERHVDNLKNKYGLNVIVAINKYTHDTKAEIEFLQAKLQEKGIDLSLVESWEKGGEGAEDLAEKIVNLTQKTSNFKFAYELNETIEEKINSVAKKIYGAENVEYTDEAKLHIKEIEKLGYSNLPVCIAKTQYSFSDDPKNLECKEPFNIHVQDVVLKAGAEFIVVLTGKIMTMPGLPRVPSAESIDLDADGNIIGIF